MEIAITYVTRHDTDVVLLYDNSVVFANSITGAQYIAESAREGLVPFATLIAPVELHRSSIVHYLIVYHHSANDYLADKFVFHDRQVFAAEWSDTRALLPAQDFWRVIAAMYRLHSSIASHAV